jgi:esterase/lipase superfamily enzyme
MKIEYHKTLSVNLGREIEYKTYGDRGRGVLVFPSQDKRFYEWEDNGMIDVLAPMIEAGEFHLICCDSIDAETWSLTNGDYDARIRLHESWFNYIVEELIPEVSGGQRLILSGCSMGGYHAGNFFFRRPDLFDGVVSLSGLFHADYFFPNYDNELIYRNSPLDFLANIGPHSLFAEQYKGKTLIFCCGQGNYERVTGASTGRLQGVLQNLKIDAWFDLWGKDVSHDFYWWRRQAQYFFGKITEGAWRKAA